jgi:chemotaxis protein methyltransferase CheR
VDEAVFESFRTFIYDQTGVTMRRGKEALLRARIAERMRALGLEDESVYLRLVRTDATGDELRRFINAITTNTTSFFRAPEHFGVLADHARAWDASGGGRYRVWCAASSTGEEPWSIAMVLARWVPEWARRDVKVLATDIDTDVLAEAKAARYRDAALSTVPADYRARFLTPAGADEAGNCQVVRSELRAMVSFARLNLVRFPYPMAGPFDVIFCRNVLIYFDNDTRLRVLSAMIQLLDPRGLLILGPSESAMGLDHLVRRTTDSVYVPRERGQTWTG